MRLLGIGKKIAATVSILIGLSVTGWGAASLPLFNPFLQTDLICSDTNGLHNITNANEVSAQVFNLNGVPLASWSSLISNTGGFISMNSFSPHNDGVTADDAAIYAAITAAQTAGVQVVDGGSNYNMGVANLQILSGTNNLVFQNMGFVSITPTNPVLLIANDVGLTTNLLFRNVSFTGLTAAHGVDAAACLEIGGGGWHLSFENCTFIHGTNVIWIGNGNTNWQIDKIHFHRCTIWKFKCIGDTNCFAVQALATTLWTGGQYPNKPGIAADVTFNNCDIANSGGTVGQCCFCASNCPITVTGGCYVDTDTNIFLSLGGNLATTNYVGSGYLNLDSTTTFDSDEQGANYYAVYADNNKYPGLDHYIRRSALIEGSLWNRIYLYTNGTMLDPSYNNVIIGQETVDPVVLDGYGNAGIGAGSGGPYTATSMTGNSWVGAGALSQQIYGKRNSVVGEYGLGTTLTNAYNSGLGYSTLFNTLDDYCVAIGAYSGANHVTGSNDIFIGSGQEGNPNGTDTNNIYFGAIVDTNLIAGTNIIFTNAGVAIVASGANSFAPSFTAMANSVSNILWNSNGILYIINPHFTNIVASLTPSISGANFTANTVPLSSLAQGTSGQVLIANTSSADTYSSTPAISAANFTANTMPVATIVNSPANTVLGNATAGSAANTATGNVNLTNVNANALLATNSVTVNAAGFASTVGFIGNGVNITNLQSSSMQSMIVGTLVASSPEYYPIGGGGSGVTATAVKAQTLMAGAYVLSNLFISTYDILAGTNVTVTLFTNGVSTGITASVTNSAGTANLSITANDSTHSCILTNGTGLEVQVSQIGTPAASVVSLTASWQLIKYP